MGYGKIAKAIIAFYGIPKSFDEAEFIKRLAMYFPYIDFSNYYLIEEDEDVKLKAMEIMQLEGANIYILITPYVLDLIDLKNDNGWIVRAPEEIEYLIHEIMQKLHNEGLLRPKTGVPSDDILSDITPDALADTIKDVKNKKQKKTLLRKFVSGLKKAKSSNVSVEDIPVYKREIPTLTFAEIDFEKKQGGTLTHNYVYGGLKVQNTKFSYFLMSDNPNAIVQSPISCSYVELKRQIVETIEKSTTTDVSEYTSLVLSEAVWTAPVGIEKWFALIADETNGAAMLTSPKYPVHAYFIHEWEPIYPETVVIIDTEYIVVIVKWRNKILDLKFTPKPQSKERMFSDIVELLDAVTYTGVPRFLIPYDPIDTDVVNLYKSVSEALLMAESEGPLSYVKLYPEFLDIRKLPPLKKRKVPPFRNISINSIWDFIYDKNYLKYLKLTVNYSAILLLLTGIIIGFSSSLYDMRAQIGAAYADIMNTKDKMAKVESYVRDLRKYNVVAKQQTDLPIYLAKIYSIFGDKLLSLKYDASMNKFVGTFDIEGALSVEDIQNTLLQEGLADQVKIMSIDAGQKQLTITWFYNTSQMLGGADQ